jgi:lysophospholipase L1-like esterase
MRPLFPLFLAAVFSSLSFVNSLRADDLLVTNGQKIAFLGDSITAAGWDQAGGYVKLVISGLKEVGVTAVPIPAGVGGNTSRDMIARFDSDVLAKQPDWLTISCGVNDVWHGDGGVDLETYKKNITSMVDQALAKNIKVMILTSTPIGEQDNGNNQKLIGYNDFLRQLARDRKLPLADLNADIQAALRKNPSKGNGELRFTVDGVHMNSEGNTIMARGILKAFGVSDDNLSKIDDAWMKGDARIVSNPFGGDTSITLAQYRALEKIATDRKVDIGHIAGSAWADALVMTYKAHPHDDPDQNAFINETVVHFKSILSDLINNSNNLMN